MDWWKTRSLCTGHRQLIGPTWVSCRCVKITLVPRWANIVMNIAARRSNMEPTCWSYVRPRSKITLGQHRRTTYVVHRFNERWTTNVGPTLCCYLRLPLWHARARCIMHRVRRVVIRSLTRQDLLAVHNYTDLEWKRQIFLFTHFCKHWLKYTCNNC